MKEQHQIIIYTAPDGDVQVNVFFQDETLWLPQKALAELFGVEVPAISKHLANIYETGELERTATISKMETVRQEGNRKVKRVLEYYNLDAIIAVGYRVNSFQATQFRIWATSVLREYIMKGFALDDKRLKQGKHWGKDYFDELLERIREIRASERRFYQKITDIYAQCSIDYDSKAPVTQAFCVTVQNKLHWAITGQTAAEIIRDRASSTKPHMGLSTWKNAPKGKILKSDVGIAKNYLAESALRQLNRIVTMQDWVNRLDAFLQFNEYDILQDAGKVNAEVAKHLAEAEYDTFRVVQDREFSSDFDKEIEQITADAEKPADNTENE